MDKMRLREYYGSKELEMLAKINNEVSFVYDHTGRPDTLKQAIILIRDAQLDFLNAVVKHEVWASMWDLNEKYFIGE